MRKRIIRKGIFQSIISIILLFTMIFQIFSISGALTDYNSFRIQGYSANNYKTKAHTFNNGFSQSAHNKGFIFRVGQYYSGGTKYNYPDSVYCIQPGKAINTNDMIIDSNKSYLNGITNSKTTATQKDLLLQLVFSYGENLNYWDANATCGLTAWYPRYVATQILLWEVVTEDRDAKFNYTTHSKEYVRSILDDFTSTEKSNVLLYYNQYSDAIKEVLKEPSLNTSSVKPTYKDGVYTAVITESNNVLSTCTVTCTNPDVKVNVSGNKITLTSTKPIVIDTSLSVKRNISLVGVKYYKGVDNISTQAFAKAIPGDIPLPTQVLSVTVEKNDNGKIEVQKVSTDTALTNNNSNYSLQGAVFEITGPNNFKTTITTNENGFAQTNDNLLFGTYKIKEITAPKGYVLNTNEYTVNIDANTPVKNAIVTASQTVNETPKGGYIRVYKRDTQTDSVPQGNAKLTGAVFEVYDSNNTLVDTINCGNEVYGISKLLPLGTYSVKEKVAPTGYNLNETPVSVSITETAESTTQSDVVIKDTVISGNIEISKFKISIKEDGSLAEETPFEGVEFTLKSVTTGIIYEGTEKATDVNGKIRFENLPFDTYTIIENTPDGYEDTESVNITIDENGKTYYTTIVNTVKTSDLTIFKHTKNDINIADIDFEIVGTTLDGREYKKIVTTNNDGSITTTLPYGDYAITELSCEANKYYIIPSSQKIKFPTNRTLEFYNEEIKSELKIEKFLQNNNFEYELGAGITFKLIGTSYAGYEVNKLITTDDNGTAVFKNIPIGEYVLSEISNKNNEKYILNEPMDVTISENSAVSIEILNDIKTSSINLTKYRKDNKEILVENAEYTLYDANGEVFKTAITDKDGKFTLENIPYGEYILKETKAPEGYLINEEEFAIDVKNHAEIINIETEDEYIIKNVKIAKRSRETGQLLSDTEFTMYCTETNRVIDTVVTDETGYATFFNVSYGNYVIKETRPPEGFANDSEPVFISLDAEYEVEATHEFTDSPLPQTGVELSNSILLLVLTFLLFVLSIACNKFWVIAKENK